MLSSQARSFMMLFQTVEIPRSKRVRDEQTVEEYREDDVQDSVYISVLKQTYEMFKVLIYAIIITLFYPIWAKPVNLSSVMASLTRVVAACSYM